MPDTIPTEDRISREAVRHFYALPGLPDDATWAGISEVWRPYRMWATVLLHMAWRRLGPDVPRCRQNGDADQSSSEERRRSASRPRSRRRS